MNRGHWLFVLPAVAAGALLAGCGDSAEKIAAQAAQERLAAGEALYTKNCKVCHAQGINGAPIVGNKKMWGPRAVQGAEVLVDHAVSGFGLMPAKGGKTELAREDIATIVNYMLAQIQ